MHQSGVRIVVEFITAVVVLPPFAAYSMNALTEVLSVNYHVLHVLLKNYPEKKHF